MFSKSVLLAAASVLSLVPSSSAIYGATKKINVAMYWGQGANQQQLWDFCQNSAVDIIPIGFINAFPPAANGYVGANYGNACFGTGYYYKGPGYNGSAPVAANDLLPNYCKAVQDGIPKCQAAGKKIILSIGGAPPAKTYKNQLKTAADGEYLANFIWKAYGPKDPTWTGPRPLDRGGDNKTESIVIDIDGFDFDIEDTVNGLNPTVGETAAYIACIKKLRTLMQAQTAKTGKEYLITGSPQCTLDPALGGKEKNMDAMIYYGGFDILFIQFYNQGKVSCTARSRASKTGGVFNYAAWLTYVRQTGSASSKARLYAGLLGGPAGSAFAPGDYLNVTEVKNLLTTYGKSDQFGGTMLWEAQATRNNTDPGIPAGQRYWHVVKNAMSALYPGVPLKRDIIETLDAPILDAAAEVQKRDEVFDPPSKQQEREVIVDAEVQQAAHAAHMKRHQHHHQHHHRRR